MEGTSGLIDEVRHHPVPPDKAVARAIRMAARVSQGRLADELGVHRVTVARWEQGTRIPRGDQLQRYLDILAKLQDAVGPGAIR